MQLGMEVTFVVGRKDSCRGIVDEERDAHLDVVEVDVEESYESLPAKVLAGLVAVGEDMEADMLWKVDDDVFLDVGRLLSRMNDEEVVDSSWWKGDMGIYWGYFHNDSIPDPDPKSKWHDSKYDAVAFPPYAAGPAYGLSQTLIRWIVESHKLLRNDWRNEDVSVGSWLHGLRIHRIHDEGMLRYLDCGVRDYTHPPWAQHIQIYDGAQRTFQSPDERDKFVNKMLQDLDQNVQNKNLIRSKCCTV